MIDWYLVLGILTIFGFVAGVLFFAWLMVKFIRD